MNNTNDSLGDRMKEYENISRIYLTRRCPIIIRLDGCHFHTFTKGFNRPFDDVLIKTMQETAKYLCANIMGCKLAYTQSDEISLLLVDYERLESEGWYDNNLQKIVSVASSIATMTFNKLFNINLTQFCGKNCINIKENYNQYHIYIDAIGKGAMFDARAFILPKEEVCNYFIWRQQDCTRNSIQMVAQANFSHKELEGKSCDILQDMLHEQKGINWNDYDTMYKRGTCVIKQTYEEERLIKPWIDCEIVTRTRWIVDKNIPIFTQDRDYIDKYAIVKENII